MVTEAAFFADPNSAMQSRADFPTFEVRGLDVREYRDDRQCGESARVKTGVVAAYLTR